jgi:hypothetical protein
MNKAEQELYDVFSVSPKVERSTLDHNNSQFNHPEILPVNGLALRKISAEMFGSYVRLPILGTIYNLSPAPRSTTFAARKIASVLDFVPGNVHKELRRIKETGLIDFVSEETRQYVRLNHIRWNIVKTALNVAAIEDGEG